MALTDIRAKSARPQDKPYKLSDADGMYLLVQPNGAKYWRLKYRHAGKEKVLALGVFPEVGLKTARERRANARHMLASRRDPAAERKSEKLLANLRAGNTFETVAREWWEAKRNAWSTAYQSAVLSRLEDDLFPKIGALPITEIEAPALLEVIRGIERRGALELAKKAFGAAGQVFRYAIATARAKSDPTRDLRGALKTRDVQHYARLTEADLPEFLEKLDAYDGNLLTRLAIRLLMLTFVRTGELRGARWPEFDQAKREWRIPAERMKMGVQHIVPLSTQAVAVLEQIRNLSGKRDHVFPNEHHPQKCMSENTILFGLYRMGYRGRATGHGFRATASTILNEQGWNRDAIERQLAHSEKDDVRAAYNHAEYLPERRRMMQHWADYLDARHVGAKVISLQRASATS